AANSDRAIASAVSAPRPHQSLLLGLVLVLLGAILLGANTGLFSWNVVAPAALIVLGVFLLARPSQRRSGAASANAGKPAEVDPPLALRRPNEGGEQVAAANRH